MGIKNKGILGARGCEEAGPQPRPQGIISLLDNAWLSKRDKIPCGKVGRTMAGHSYQSTPQNHWRQAPIESNELMNQGTLS